MISSSAPSRRRRTTGDEAGDEQLDASPRAVAAVDRQPRHRVDVLAGVHEPDPARGEDAHRRAGAEQVVDAGAHPAEQVLAVVEDDEAVPVGQRAT